MTRAFIALALLFAVTPQARADLIPGTSFNIGVWNGGAYSGETAEAFSHCAASAPYRSGIYLIISLGRDGRTWGLGFGDPNWKLVEGETYHVKFAIDRLWLTEADVQARGDKFVSVSTTNREFISAFQAGQVLRVTTPKTQFGFSLLNSSRVVNALETCVGQYGGNPNGGNPFANPSVSSASSNPFVGTQSRNSPTARSVAVNFLSGLLNTGSLGNFHLISIDAAPKVMKDYALAWRNNEVIGGLYVTSADVTLDQQQTKLIAGDTDGCTRGTFASGASNDTVGGGIQVRRIFTVCTGSDGYANTYSLYPLKEGGFYIIVNSGRDTKQTQMADELFFHAITKPEK